MNARDRVLTTLDHTEPDRVPIYEGTIDNVAIAEEFGATTSMHNLKKGMRLLSRIPGWRFWYTNAMRRGFLIASGVKRLYDFNKKVGIDMVLAPTACLLTKCAFPQWDTFVDEFGRMFKVDVYNGADQTVYMGGYFKSKEEYEAWGDIDPYHPSREKLVKKCLKVGGEKDLFVAPFASGIVEAAWEGFGFENFSRMLYRDKPFVQRVFDDRGKFGLELAKNVIDMGAEVLFMHDDLAYKGRPFLSPKMMEQYVYPHYRTIVNEVHRRGAKILLHSCGYITELIPKLLEIGFDGLNPIEPTAGNDIFAIKSEYGQRVTIIGNVSPQDLATSTPDEIAAYTRRLMREVAPGGGFILASGHSINPFVKKENYLAMLDVAKKYGIYPIQNVPP